MVFHSLTEIGIQAHVPLAVRMVNSQLIHRAHLLHSQIVNLIVLSFYDVKTRMSALKRKRKDQKPEEHVSSLAYTPGRIFKKHFLALVLMSN